MSHENIVRLSAQIVLKCNVFVKLKPLLLKNVVLVIFVFDTRKTDAFILPLVLHLMKAIRFLKKQRQVLPNIGQQEVLILFKGVLTVLMF